MVSVATSLYLMSGGVSAACRKGLSRSSSIRIVPEIFHALAVGVLQTQKEKNGDRAQAENAVRRHQDLRVNCKPVQRRSSSGCRIAKKIHLDVAIARWHRTSAHPAERNIYRSDYSL